jgi:hypothetical protein
MLTEMTCPFFDSRELRMLVAIGGIATCITTSAATTSAAQVAIRRSG